MAKRYYLASRLRARQEQGHASGTALLELFGCPILKAFSNRQVRRMTREFVSVEIRNVQPGFARLVDVVPLLRYVEPMLRWIDRVTEDAWGFYQVVRADKAG
jgi:hypothetical protein